MKHCKWIILFILAIFFSVSYSYADAAGNNAVKEIEVTAYPDKNEVLIGDQVTLNVVVANAKGHEVSFYERPEHEGDFVFIASRPIKFKGNEKDKKGYQYVMGIYSTGPHVIPPVSVRYRNTEKDEWKTIPGPQVPITVKSTLTGKDTDIKDIKGLIARESRLPILLILFILLFIAGSSYILYRNTVERMREIAERAKKRPAHEIAYSELNKLRNMNLPAKGMVKEYYSILSDIIRRYIENRFSLRAPEMTTEEFMEIVKRSKDLAPDDRSLLNEFLSICDMVKFAKHAPKPLEMLDSFSAGEKFIDKTRLIVEDEEDKK